MKFTFFDEPKTLIFDRHVLAILSSEPKGLRRIFFCLLTMQEDIKHVFGIGFHIISMMNFSAIIKIRIYQSSIKPSRFLK
jgi:hypothetical protein